MSELVKSQLNEVSLSWDTPEKIKLIQKTICPTVTCPDNFNLFLEIARSTRLNPLMKQIHARMQDVWDSFVGAKVPKMIIIVGIDGYRAIASDTNLLVGIGSSTLEFKDGSKYPFSATTVVKKLVGGIIAEFEHTCYWSEYAPFYKNKQGNMKLSETWEKMPCGQLGKCSEVGALRKGFSTLLCGKYIQEEMEKSEFDIETQFKEKKTFDAKAEKETVIEKSTAEQFQELKSLLEVSTKISLNGDVDGLKDWYEITLNKEQRKVIAPKMAELKKLCAENKHKFVKSVDVSQSELDAFDAEFENVNMETGEIL